MQNPIFFADPFSSMAAYYGHDVEEYLKQAINPCSCLGRKAPSSVLQKDADLILEYINDLTVNRGIAPSTAKTTATLLVMFSRACPDFSQLSTSIFKSHIAKSRLKLKQNTLRRYIPLSKKFTFWLVEKDYNRQIDLKEIDKIKTPTGYDIENRTAESMLTGPEVNAIISAAKNSRDRALLAMLYDAAARPIELVSATWNDIRLPQSGEHLATFNTSKKTGIPRYVPLLNAVPFLLAWKNDFPMDPSGSAPVFVTLNPPHNKITQNIIRRIVHSCVSLAGISKTVTPYHFRHTRISHMIVDEVPETMVKKMFWGSTRSNMLSTYAHLGDGDIDRVLLAKAGIITPEKKTEVGVRPKQCKECGKINASTDRYCSICGRSLTAEAESEIVEVRRFAKSPEKLRMLADELEKAEQIDKRK
jgi:integrase/recombinase XerD